MAYKKRKIRVMTENPMWMNKKNSYAYARNGRIAKPHMKDMTTVA